MTSSSDPKAIKCYRKAVVDLLDTNFSKLNSVLEGSLEAFARKAFEAKLISDQVMKGKSFTDMIGEFKAGMEWCRNTMEVQNRCTDFIEILESLGGPAKTAGQDLNAKLLILDEKHEVFSVEPNPCERTEKVVNLLHTRIEQVPELAVVAASLKKKFRQLLIIVKKSLTNVDISDVKLIISSTLVDNSCRVSDTIRLYLYKLRKFEKVTEILDFLIEYRFIGYLNYDLLKEISNLTNDGNVSKAFKNYETEYFCKLLKSSKINLLMQVFCEYPDLSPTTAIGLPEIMFQLEESWENESMETWKRYMEINFPLSGSLGVKGVSANCILITYVCHPAKYNDILKDLCNPDILERLKSDEISVHILENETTFALQQSVTYDFELDDIQMVEAIQCEKPFNEEYYHSVPSIQPNEIIVTNSDQGNTVAARLKDSLLRRINTFDQHLISATQRLNKCETRFKSTRDEIVDLREDLAGLREELQATASACSEIKGGLEEKLQAIDQNLQKRIKEFESSEKRLTNIETKVVHDINELSEKFKASQVEVNEKLSKLQNQLDQFVEDMKKEMADLSQLYPASNAPPSDNQSKTTFIESMDTLRSKLDSFIDTLIPNKEAPVRRRRCEARKIKYRPQSQLIESNSFESMDPIDRQQSTSTSSVSSSGRGTCSHESRESLPVIVKIDNPEQQDISLLLPKTSAAFLSPVSPTGSPQMRHQSKTPAQLIPQQSNEISSETHHNIVEIVWAMDDLADQLKNLAGNF